jgi:hypothetical protein
VKKRTWVKPVVSLALVGAIGAGICSRWGLIGRGSDPLAAWGRGNPTLAERTYYSSRIRRVVERWGQTRTTAETDKYGRFKNSYRTLLVVDTDKQAIWIEDNGIVQKNDYAELPPGLEWTLHHVTSQGNKEFSGRVVLKMRGAYSKQQPWEHFDLVGTGRGSGYCKFRFHSKGGSGDYYAGTFRPQPDRSWPTRKIENAYDSLLVTDSEYQRRRADDANSIAHANTAIEENKASWLRVEKSLYGQIERHLRKAGYELQNLKVEPGPDFSAGHAEIWGRSDSTLHKFFGGHSSIDVYLNFDYLGDDIWYAKGARLQPKRPLTPRQTLELEFLVHTTAQITGSQRGELLAKGRKMHESFPRCSSSNWKAAFANGMPVELIGICESPSAGKQWWGPDGSPLEHVPYISTDSYGRTGSDKKFYEIAWRRVPISSGVITCSFEGSRGSYSREARERYGYHVLGALSARVCSFDGNQRRTTWRVGYANRDWQTALIVGDKAGETKFLGTQRIILHPPEIEDGRIVVRCFEETASRVGDYQTDFALVVGKDSVGKTISLRRYEEEVTYNNETGLTERKFILKDLSISQIKGVCFRYSPCEYVTFRNISLVPGEDHGFDIEPGQ